MCVRVCVSVCVCVCVLCVFSEWHYNKGGAHKLVSYYLNTPTHTLTLINDNMPPLITSS